MPVFRILWPTRVTGRRNVRPFGPVILAANHSSFIDSILIPAVLRRRVTFIAKDSYFRNPKTAWFFRAVGQIPVDRSGGASANDALRTAAAQLLHGRVVALYPEGTRTADGKVFRGKTGAMRLAATTGASVVPVAIRGTAEAQGIGKKFPKAFVRLEIVFGEPIPPPAPDADAATIRQKTDALMRKISELSGATFVDLNAPKRE